MRARLKRTAGVLALLLVGLVLVPAAAGASDSPVFHEGTSPSTLGGPIGVRYPLNVAGTYVPVPMRCGSDHRVIWYAPGAGADTMWRSMTFPETGNVGHTDVALSIAGTFQPLVGDFDGDACDDVIWYAPGATADSIWYFAPDGSHVSMPLTISGTYTPVVGNFDSVTSTDEVFWYGPGSVTESIWVAATSSGSVVRGSFTAAGAPQVSGTFQPMANYPNRGILWYAPGAATDYMWQAVTAGTTAAASAPTTMGGTYTARSAAGRPLLWTPGTGVDRLVTGSPFSVDHVDLVTVPGEIDPVSAVPSSTPRTGFTVLHEPGAGTDWILFPGARAGVVPDKQDLIVSASGGTSSATGSTCAAIGTRGLVQCWGAGYGAAGADTAAPRTIQGVVGATQVATGSDFACARRNDGRILCWGSNAVGQLGRGTTGGSSASASVVAGVTGAVEVGVGDGFACARLAGGVSCWGRNNLGQLGNGSVVASTPTPVAVSDPTPTRLFSVTQDLAVGAGHACAIVSDRAYCWGGGSAGQLGNGSTTVAQRTPVLATSCTTAVCRIVVYSSITAGRSHTCAVIAGLAHCWGSDETGQLGNGPGAVSSTRPALVVGLPTPDATYAIAQMSAGSDRTCVVTSGGRLWCWGSNLSGVLGTGGAATTGVVPTQLGVSSAWRSVSVGGSHACATTTAATVKCWGVGAAGQLGQSVTDVGPDLADKATPSLVAYYGLYISILIL